MAAILRLASPDRKAARASPASGAASFQTARPTATPEDLDSPFPK